MKKDLSNFDEKVCALSGKCGDEIVKSIGKYLKKNGQEEGAIRGLIFCLMGSLYSVVNSAYSHSDLKKEEIQEIRDRINYDLDKIIKENK